MVTSDPQRCCSKTDFGGSLFDFFFGIRSLKLAHHLQVGCTSLLPKTFSPTETSGSVHERECTSLSLETLVAHIPGSDMIQ
jgi:hypothetical protein